jgi:hypothetical protein
MHPQHRVRRGVAGFEEGGEISLRENHGNGWWIGTVRDPPRGV